MKFLHVSFRYKQLLYSYTNLNYVNRFSFSIGHFTLLSTLIRARGKTKKSSPGPTTFLSWKLEAGEAGPRLREELLTLLDTSRMDGESLMSPRRPCTSAVGVWSRRSSDVPDMVACGSLSELESLSQVLPGCDTTNCAVPGKV